MFNIGKTRSVAINKIFQTGAYIFLKRIKKGHVRYRKKYLRGNKHKRGKAETIKDHDKMK